MADARLDADQSLMQWLRDAHAMERQAETMLAGMESRIEHYPHLRKRIAQHRKETQHQSQRLEEAIGRLGGTPAAATDRATDLAGMVQTLMTGLDGDAVMRGLLGGYTFEHYEIGSYRILIAAAAAVGDVETTRMLRQNLREEEDMAQWLSSSIDSLTAEYLEHAEAGSMWTKR